MPRRSPAQTHSDAPAASADWRALALGLAGALLCYLAHPPVGLSLLAWVGPAPWVLLARMRRLPGPRPYAALWLAGMAYWLATIQWIRLPHPANIFGLVLLAWYLGAYLPLFVALVRVAAHRAGAPLWLAAPVVWTGLEWLRARLLSGFLMASLAHTQVRFPWVIQIADVFDEYGVTFLIVLVAACAAQAVPLPRSDDAPASADELEEPGHWRRAIGALAPAALALWATLSYGYWRLNGEALARPDASPGPTIALIQSDMVADWKGDADRDTLVMQQMDRLSDAVVRESKRPVDLVVWPETMYRDPLTRMDASHGPPAEMFDAEQLNATRRELGERARRLGAALLVGLERYNAVADNSARDASGRLTGYRIDAYNSSALVDRHGELVGTYDKMHLLPFGEFIPLAGWLPFLNNYSPLTGSAVPGGPPEPLFLNDVPYSVNICYETVLPQLIREQFVHLIRRTSVPPDVMINLTTDAWYWGSSELDMHLASGAFRAVEMRTPLVVAANRGLSAYVDYFGRVVQATERNQPASLVAQVRLNPSSSSYPSVFAAYGDWFALVCLLCCMVLAALAWHDRRRSRSSA
jgi:apolipoprotein N-acyltransferase